MSYKFNRNVLINGWMVTPTNKYMAASVHHLCATPYVIYLIYYTKNGEYFFIFNWLTPSLD
jgi:hypothetical protein